MGALSQNLEAEREIGYLHVLVRIVAAIGVSDENDPRRHAPACEHRGIMTDRRHRIAIQAYRLAAPAQDRRNTVVEADRAVVALTRSRPIESTIARSQWLSAQGQLSEAAHVLGRLLADAPPGFAAWTLPIDPLLRPLHGVSGFANVLGRLAERAR